MSRSVINFQSRCTQLENALDFAQCQLKNLIEGQPDFFPMYTVNGKWRHGGEYWTNWCEGFLPGILWILFQLTGNRYWRNKGEHYSLLLESRNA